MFADIKGSTELIEEVHPEEERAIIAAALKLMIEAVRRYDGYIVQSTGMAFLRCSARWSHMKTIRNARFTPPCACQRCNSRHTSANQTIER